jgi:hypothetical protein
MLNQLGESYRIGRISQCGDAALPNSAPSPMAALSRRQGFHRQAAQERRLPVAINVRLSGGGR